MLVTLWLVLYSFHLAGYDFSDFDMYQKTYTKNEIEERIQRYLEKDSDIRKWFTISDTALYMKGAGGGENEYVLEFASKPSLTKPHTKPFPKKGLKSAKIALDPGHFGGIFSELEKRSVTIPEMASQSIGASSHISEGTLTYLTAFLLKQLLENEGAEVYITRPGIGIGAHDLDFFSWLQHNPQVWTGPDSLSDLFIKKYNREDLLSRIQKINHFSPDIAVIIHYNSDIPDSETGFTSHNYSMAFVPGAFCREELNTKEARYEFMRLLVTDTVQDSIRLSECLGRSFETQLNVPLFSEQGKPPIPSYLLEASLLQKRGVYARNLALTRGVHAPVCYGETLIQNNRDEFERLLRQEIVIDGILGPRRVREVAQAYFLGIKNYFEEH